LRDTQDKGSARRRETQRRMAVLREKLNDRRRDWIEQTTTSLADHYRVAAVENLNITGMVRRVPARPAPDDPTTFLPNGAAAKTGLNRVIHDSLWGRFA